MAEKRDILQPLEANLDWKIKLTNDYPAGFINDSVMEIDMPELTVKLSIDDIHTITTISNKQNEDTMQLSKVWADHNASNK